jgi:hypothetical protein
MPPARQGGRPRANCGIEVPGTSTHTSSRSASIRERITELLGMASELSVRLKRDMEGSAAATTVALGFEVGSVDMVSGANSGLRSDNTLERLC